MPEMFSIYRTDIQGTKSEKATQVECNESIWTNSRPNCSENLLNDVFLFLYLSHFIAHHEKCICFFRKVPRPILSSLFIGVPGKPPNIWSPGRMQHSGRYRSSPEQMELPPPIIRNKQKNCWPNSSRPCRTTLTMKGPDHKEHQ